MPHKRTPKDDRSDTMNPNNDRYWADQANRANQAYERGDFDDDEDQPQQQRGDWLEPRWSDQIL